MRKALSMRMRQRKVRLLLKPHPHFFHDAPRRPILRSRNGHDPVEQERAEGARHRGSLAERIELDGAQLASLAERLPDPQSPDILEELAAAARNERLWQLVDALPPSAPGCPAH